jgi:hypothetical protein
MKALRTIGISVLVAGLLLGSVGTVFAEKPPDVPRGQGLKLQGKKQGFAGNVTSVDEVTGNVTILSQKGIVTIMLTEAARYKIPRVMNKWGNLTEFQGQLEGNNLSALIDRRVVALAGNDTETETWEALKFMLLPVPGLPPLHAHRTGNVTEFNPWIADNGNLGNITIEDVHGATHTFLIDEETTYRPVPEEEIASEIELGSFVTVVTTGDPKLEPGEKAIAKAIVVHRRDT